jgi:hypothetical protein
LFRKVYALVGLCLALTTASASAQGPSYESRGYGGPLYVGPNFQQGGQWSPPIYGSGSRERSYSTERHRAPQRIERAQRMPRSDETAKSAREPSKDKAQNENSSIVSIASDKDKVAPVTEFVKSDETKTDTAKTDTAGSRSENSTIASVASTPTKTPGPCKRYFPTVGLTVTVPCN